MTAAFDDIISRDLSLVKVRNYEEDRSKKFG